MPAQGKEAVQELDAIGELNVIKTSVPFLYIGVYPAYLWHQKDSCNDKGVIKQNLVLGQTVKP